MFDRYMKFITNFVYMFKSIFVYKFWTFNITYLP